jgi:RNA polymerase sigma-70 factor (ECF subfamily)
MNKRAIIFGNWRQGMHYSVQSKDMNLGSPHNEEFSQLYSKCETWLYSYLYSLLRSAANAEEVLQETAKTCWEKFDRYQPGTEFRAWACRIAYYKAQKFRERQKKTPSTFTDLFLTSVDEEAVVMADQLDARIAALNNCIKKLPPPDRKLVRSRYAPGATTKSVAATTGRSIYFVYRALARIHFILFECIEKSLSTEGK